VPRRARRALDANLTKFEDDLGACERILKTKMPFAYLVHLRTFMMYPDT
jgi:predicted membrane chloride channel (bestrophin family)